MEDPRSIEAIGAVALVLVVALYALARAWYGPIKAFIASDSSSRYVTLSGFPTFHVHLLMYLSSGKTSVDDNDSDEDEEELTRSAEAAATAPMDLVALLGLTFLPISGLVFRLGTLLAERLLYLPSVAVIGLAVYLLSSVTRLFLPARVASLARSLVLAVILAAYVQQTRTYSTIWKDDATLFLHTVQVCPRSAKAHLQVSKVYSGNNDLPQAWHHVRLAREIDPEFCDADYQIAHLHVLEANKVRALHATQPI